jgi:hypothetical protein
LPSTETESEGECSCAENACAATVDVAEAVGDRQMKLTEEERQVIECDPVVMDGSA